MISCFQETLVYYFLQIHTYYNEILIKMNSNPPRLPLKQTNLLNYFAEQQHSNSNAKSQQHTRSKDGDNSDTQDTNIRSIFMDASTCGMEKDRSIATTTSTPMPTPTTTANPTTTTTTSAAAPPNVNVTAQCSTLTSFEQERLERIKRNKEIMMQLGLGEGGAALLPCTGAGNSQPPIKARTAVGKNNRKMARRPAVVLERAQPRRRSKRVHAQKSGGDLVDVVLGDCTQALESETTEYRQEEKEMEYEESHVMRYHAGDVQDWGIDENKSGKERQCPEAGERVVGYRKWMELGMDAALAKTYSIDSRNGLVAAGGKNGHVSVFGMPQHADTDTTGECPEPLLSHKMHRGWVSEVVFVDELRLATSSNDGEICVWDLSKVQKDDSCIPKELTREGHLHASGIFSMDFCTGSGHMLSSSKDGSIVMSALEDACLRQIYRYEDVHGGGVVKCARWRTCRGVNNSHEFASCGNDGACIIQDCRSPGSTLSFSVSQTAAHTLRWNPWNEHMLFIASHDPDIVVFDVRKHDSPVHRLTGHASGTRISSLYQPQFVDCGKAVLTPGDGTFSDELFLYDLTDDGKVVSRGNTGFAVGATHMLGIEQGLGNDVVISGSRRLTVFSPMT